MAKIENSAETRKSKKTENQPTNLSYMVFPFYFKNPIITPEGSQDGCNLLQKIDNAICNCETLWERKPKTIADDVLYEYIKPNTCANSTQYLAYSLRTFSNNDQDSDLKTIRHVVWEKLNAEMPVNNGETKFRLDFGHDKSNWNCPTLLISPSFGVGMLVLGVNPKTDKVDIRELISFNYHLHKIDGQQKLYIPLELPKLNIKGNDSENDIEEKKKQLETVAEKKKEQLIITRKALFPNDAASHPIDDRLDFKLLDLVKMLLRGIPEWRLFEQGRAHVFSYYSFVKENLQLTEEEKQSMILLTRCASSKYNIPTEDFDKSRSFTSTFENIHMGSSVEGGCICTVRQVNKEGESDNDSNAFIHGFATGNLQHRYLWLYFMALMQRYVMLRMVVELSDLDLNSNTSSQREQFNRRYGYFCNTKIKSFFRDVSSFSQHNRFYNFLIDNMEVDKLYAEVESKMQIVDSYLQMQRNELMRKRNELNEKQNKKFNIISVILAVFMAGIAFIQLLDIIRHWN